MSRSALGVAQTGRSASLDLVSLSPRDREMRFASARVKWTVVGRCEEFGSASPVRNAGLTIRSGISLSRMRKITHVQSVNREAKALDREH